LGFHIPGRYDKVLDIEECFLQKEPSNSIRLFIKEFAIKNRYDFFNLYKTQGFLRNLIIRTSTTGDIMLIVSFFTKDMSKIEALLDAVQMNSLKSVLSIMLLTQRKTTPLLILKLFIIKEVRSYLKKWKVFDFK
jgi:23S rRNA (uracil1939-C5)-methyltransferase